MSDSFTIDTCMFTSLMGKPWDVSCSQFLRQVSLNGLGCNRTTNLMQYRVRLYWRPKEFINKNGTEALDSNLEGVFRSLHIDLVRHSHTEAMNK